MQSGFTPCIIPEIASGVVYGLVKFYGRVAHRSADHGDTFWVDDCGSSVLVNLAHLEGIVLEKGEMYRFMGETDETGLPIASEQVSVKLHIPPVPCEGFEGDVYEKALRLRQSFESEFHSLVGYAIRK